MSPEADEDQRLVLQQPVGVTQVPANGSAPAVIPNQQDAVPEGRIEETSKVVENLRTRVGGLDSQFVTMIFSEFTVIGVGLAFAGFFLSRAPSERIALSVTKSLHFQVYLWLFVFGAAAFVLLASITLLLLVTALRVCSENLSTPSTLDVVGSDRKSLLTFAEYQQAQSATTDFRRLASLDEEGYDLKVALLRKLRFRHFALDSLWLQVIAFVGGSLGAILLLLSGH